MSIELRSLSFLVLAALALAGCPPTISEPRSYRHLDELAEGERHMAHGRYEEAVGEFESAANAADRRVDQDEALYRETRALIELHRYAEAVEILDEVGNRRPVSRRTSRAIFEASLIRLDRLHQREQAMAGFERVMRETPEDGLGTRALFYLMRDFEAQNDIPGAVALCDRLYADLGDTTLGDDLLRTKSNLLLLTGDRAGARAALEECVQRYPYPYGERWDNAITTLAEMDVEDGQPRRAIERLEVLVHRAERTNLVGSYILPSMPAAQLRIAEIYRDELRDFEAASDAFEDFEDKFPNSAMRDDAYYRAGVMWIDVGNDRRRGCRLLRKVVRDFEVGHARRLAEERIAADCRDQD